MNLKWAIIVMVICIWYICNYYTGQVAHAHPSGKIYFVNNNQSESEKTRKVALLHELWVTTIRLFAELKTHGDPGVVRLLNKYKYREVQIDELPPSYTRVFAFNVNKGDRISICLTKENKLNELIFVLIHELAHGMTVAYSHDDAFWNNFRYLLRVAIQAGLYKNTDYNTTPVDFCKYAINHNPINTG
tara:strand:+ start:73 stop:636 length:564 start_codon:yes stop_codon:yes gene_type:complete